MKNKTGNDSLRHYTAETDLPLMLMISMLLIPAVSTSLRGGSEPFRGHLEATGVLQHVFIP